MENLLSTTDQNQIVISAIALEIRAFRKIWTRDRSEAKRVARAELALVELYANYKSPYASYAEKERMQVLLADIFPERNWKPDKTIEEAIEKFKELQTSYSMRFLEASKNAGHELMRFLNTVRLDQIDDNGKLLYKPTDITRALADSGKVLEAIDQWQKKVKEELDLQANSIRGGGEAGMFEDSADAEWIQK